MASKCGIMDLTIYSATVMYSYFTHPAVVDNFMLLSPQLAWPANQCPLKRPSVHMSLDPVSINSVSAHISTSSTDCGPKQYNGSAVCTLQEAATGRCSLRWHIDLQWLHNIPTMNCTICAVWLSHAIFKPLFIQPRSFLARPSFTLIKFHSFTPGCCPL